MGDLTHLKLPPDAKPREHFDVTLAQLSAWLAEAETIGGWRALQAIDDNDPACVKYLCDRVLDRDTRARYWEARIRGELMERKG